MPKTREHATFRCSDECSVSYETPFALGLIPYFNFRLTSLCTSDAPFKASTLDCQSQFLFFCKCQSVLRRCNSYELLLLLVNPAILVLMSFPWLPVNSLCMHPPGSNECDDPMWHVWPLSVQEKNASMAIVCVRTSYLARRRYWVGDCSIQMWARMVLREKMMDMCVRCRMQGQ